MTYTRNNTSLRTELGTSLFQISSSTTQNNFLVKFDLHVSPTCGISKLHLYCGYLCDMRNNSLRQQHLTQPPLPHCRHMTLALLLPRPTPDPATQDSTYYSAQASLQWHRGRNYDAGAELQETQESPSTYKIQSATSLPGQQGI
jgi:hypothetical protein